MVVPRVVLQLSAVGRPEPSRARRRLGGDRCRRGVGPADLKNDDGDNGSPFKVVVDGRTLSWQELGHALGSYEGWNFRPVIEARVEQAHTGAEVIDIGGRRRSRSRTESP